MASEQEIGAAELERFAAAMVAVGKLQGVLPLNTYNKLWVVEVTHAGSTWVLATNPTLGALMYKEITVEPFHTYIEFNGWPAGMLAGLGAMGGEFAAGSLANMKTLCEALEALVKKETL